MAIFISLFSTLIALFTRPYCMNHEHMLCLSDPHMFDLSGCWSVFDEVLVFSCDNSSLTVVNAFQSLKEIKELLEMPSWEVT